MRGHMHGGPGMGGPGRGRGPGMGGFGGPGMPPPPPRRGFGGPRGYHRGGCLGCLLPILLMGAALVGLIAAILI